MHALVYACMQMLLRVDVDGGRRRYLQTLSSVQGVARRLPLFVSLSLLSSTQEEHSVLFSFSFQNISWGRSTTS